MRMRSWKTVRAGANGPKLTPQAFAWIAMRHFGNMSILVHAQPCRWRRTTGLVVRHAIRQMKFDCVAVAFDDVQTYVEIVVDTGQVAATIKIQRCEQSRQTMVVFRVQPHQVRKAPGQQFLAWFEYGRHAPIIAPVRTAASLSDNCNGRYNHRLACIFKPDGQAFVAHAFANAQSCGVVTVARCKPSNSLPVDMATTAMVRGT